MNLLGIDLETSALNARTGQIIEIGAALFNVPSRTIIYQFSTLCYATENPVEHINHLSPHALSLANIDITAAFVTIFDMLIKEADAFVAHNFSFEKTWLAFHMPWMASLAQPWICTRHHIRWPYPANLKLESIAATMNVPYLNAHRALPDVNIMFDCLKKLPDLEQQLLRLLEPCTPCHEVVS